MTALETSTLAIGLILLVSGGGLLLLWGLFIIENWTKKEHKP